MSVLLVLPVLIPLLTACISVMLWRWRLAQRWLNVAGSAALLGASIALLLTVRTEGVIATQLGGWPSPFGITFVADTLSAIMVLLGALTAIAVSVYSLGSIDERRERYFFHPLMQTLMMGVSGAFLTGDLFNLYVWFEVMLISSFALLALGGERAQLEGAIKYVTLNLLSSAVFLAGVGIVYGVAGTLNMADLSVKLADVQPRGVVTTVSMLFLIAFGVKAAVFPLFFWLPASYHTPPVAVSAIFAGLLTKVGVYALIRAFTLIFPGDDDGLTHTIIVVIAGMTMITGVLGAAAQNEFRRILSFHIISQIGYMIMGLGLLSPLALAGSVFYIMHHIIVKTNLFLVSGVVYRLQGSYRLKDLGGIYKSRPWLAVLFLVPAMSLAGVPPLSGFFAKFILVKAGLELEQHTIVAVALGVGLLTLFSMTKIWGEAFWKAPPHHDRAAEPTPPTRAELACMVAPIIGMCAITVSIGVFAQPVFELAQRAAEQLVDPGEYVRAVLGDPSGAAPGEAAP